MKKLFYISLILLVQPAFSQGKKKADSLLQNKKVQYDSLVKDKWHNKIDSLKSLGNLEKLKDSLKVTGWADSLRSNVTGTFVKKENAFRTKVDSLILLNQPITKFQQKLDSLKQKQQSLLTEISAKQTQLQQRVTSRYNKWGIKLDSLGIEMPNANLSSVTNKLNLSNTNLPALPNATLPNTQLPTIPNLDRNDFSSLNLSKDLNDVGGELSIPNADQFKKWEEELKNISSPIKSVTGRLGEAKDALKDPGKAAESAVGQIGDVKSVTDKVGVAEKLIEENEAMETAEKLKDPHALKEEVRQKAIDHFAGKEEVLKLTMDQMAKIKQKMPSLESLDKLPKNYKWPKNGLKGKPFRERVRFGLNFGSESKKDTVIVDLYPNISYNLTGRIEVGLGGIYRLRENTKNWQLDQANPVWGVTMFGTFKTFKSVRLRVESDAASYPQIKGFGEAIARQWRWTWLTGVQTTFKISQNFTCNVQMLYDFDKSLIKGFPEQLVLRFGVQYKLKIKKAKII